jgi:uncharacterized membrane protein YeaQ/YmgE (transglycosylase-associated protein family)
MQITSCAVAGLSPHLVQAPRIGSPTYPPFKAEDRLTKEPAPARLRCSLDEAFAHDTGTVLPRPRSRSVSFSPETTFPTKRAPWPRRPSTRQTLVLNLLCGIVVSALFGLWMLTKAYGSLRHGHTFASAVTGFVGSYCLVYSFRCLRVLRRILSRLARLAQLRKQAD